jgi:hypothetical protein
MRREHLDIAPPFHVERRARYPWKGVGPPRAGTARVRTTRGGDRARPGSATCARLATAAPRMRPRPGDVRWPDPGEGRRTARRGDPDRHLGGPYRRTRRCSVADRPATVPGASGGQQRHCEMRDATRSSWGPPGCCRGSPTPRSRYRTRRSSGHRTRAPEHPRCPVQLRARATFLRPSVCAKRASMSVRSFGTHMPTPQTTRQVRAQAIWWHRRRSEGFCRPPRAEVTGARRRRSRSRPRVAPSVGSRRSVPSGRCLRASGRRTLAASPAAGGGADLTSVDPAGSTRALALELGGRTHGRDGGCGLLTSVACHDRGSAGRVGNAAPPALARASPQTRAARTSSGRP